MAVFFHLLALLHGGSALAGICDWYDGSGTSGPGACWARSAFNELTTTQKDCEEARSSSFYKKHGCGPQDGKDNSSPGYGSMSCDSSADCFGTGSATDGRGIGDLGNLLGQMREEAARLHAFQAKRLDSASTTIDNWQKNLGTAASKAQGDITGLSGDRALVSSAIDSFAGKGKFQGGSANDPTIGRDLGLFADAKAGEDAIRKEMEKVEQGIATLEGMRGRTDGRNDNLNSLSDISGTGGRKLAAAGKSAGIERPVLPDPNASGAVPSGHSANGVSDITRSKEDSLGSGSASAITSGGANGAAGAGTSALSGESLRLKLAAALSAEKNSAKGGGAARDAEAVQDATFQSDLDHGALQGGNLGSADPKHALEEFMSAGGKTPKFSLAGADTDREVKHLLAAEAEGKQRSGGILASESADLFQRVRRAHRSCVQRQCVALRALLPGRAEGAPK